jgi:hypothetical protein
MILSYVRKLNVNCPGIYSSLSYTDSTYMAYNKAGTGILESLFSDLQCRAEPKIVWAHDGPDVQSDWCSEWLDIKSVRDGRSKSIASTASVTSFLFQDLPRFNLVIDSFRLSSSSLIFVGDNGTDECYLTQVWSCLSLYSLQQVIGYPVLIVLPVSLSHVA